MLAQQTSSTTVTPRPEIHTLDSLARRTSDELAALYRSASVSKTMRAADGALQGRMLAVHRMPEAIGRLLARWAASPSFLWEGKTFQASSDTRGVGHNRVVARGVLGKQNLFPFDTSFGASAVDGKPTLILDYDLDVNPAYIRHVHDEIREVSPGLFLGPAMWKRDHDKLLVLWFALDSRLS